MIKGRAVLHAKTWLLSGADASWRVHEFYDYEMLAVAHISPKELDFRDGARLSHGNENKS